MTWRFQATLSDHIHRLGDDAGRISWGVVHHCRDDDHPQAQGTAEVDLPTGPAELLLVDPLPGGLVLDIVRSYQGLTSGEMCTLVLGLFAELRTVSRPAARLSLSCLGLDAEGHPRIIPGIEGDTSGSVRRALGEMLYHAAYGSPWRESLLPVGIALQRHPEPLQLLVAELLNDSAPAAEGPSSAEFDSAIAEVSDCLRRTAEPIPLPLLPAERALDPAQALTARLRAGNVLRRSSAESGPSASSAGRSGSVRSTTKSIRSTTGSERSATGNEGFATKNTRSTVGNERLGVGETADPARRLRSASRQRSCEPRLLKWLSRSGPGLARKVPRPVGRRGLLILLAVCIAVCGAAVLVQSWSSSIDTAADAAAAKAKPGAGRSAPHAGSGEREAEQGDTAPGRDDAADRLSDEEVVALLEQLCDRRAQALGAGDSGGLAQLTVPESTAAAADELIDVGSFAGHDFAIELHSPAVVDRSEMGLVVTARMSTTASIDGEQVSFDARQVEFHLSLHSGVWKVAEVIETGSG